MKTFATLAKEETKKTIQDRGLDKLIDTNWFTLSYDSFINGAIHGYLKASDDVVKYLQEYKEAYSEEIFAPIRKDELDPISRDRISAQMARHILDTSMREIQELGQVKSDGK